MKQLGTSILAVLAIIAVEILREVLMERFWTTWQDCGCCHGRGTVPDLYLGERVCWLCLGRGKVSR